MKQYKTVAGPIELRIKGKESYADAVKQYAAIIDRETVGGWSLDRIQRIPVTREPGCLASLLGKKEETTYFNMLVFAKDDSEYIDGVTTNVKAEVDFARTEEHEELIEEICNTPQKESFETEEHNEEDISMSVKCEQSNIVIRIFANIYDIIDRIVKHLPENNSIRRIISRVLDLFSKLVLK